MLTRSALSRKRRLAEAHQTLRFLPVHGSLLPVWQWIRDLESEHRLTPEQVVIALDFDGTVSTLVFGDQKGPPWEYIRGGHDSRAFLRHIQPYPWFIISARAYSREQVNDIVGTFRDDMRLPFPPAWCRHWPHEAVQTNEIVEPRTRRRYRTYQRAHIVGCVAYGEEYALEKEVSIEHALAQLDGPRPRLLVFVDDNAGNVLQVSEYYRTHHPHMLFLGVFYYPQVNPQPEDKELARLLTTGEPQTALQ